MVTGPVTVPVDLTDTAPLLTATTTTIAPDNDPTRVPDDASTPVDPAPVTTTITTVDPELLPTTTTIPANNPTTIAISPEPKITTTLPDNTPTPVVPEPDTTTTTCIYANTPTKNVPRTDPTTTFVYTNPPTQNSYIPEMTPPTVPSNNPNKNDSVTYLTPSDTVPTNTTNYFEPVPDQAPSDTVLTNSTPPVDPVTDMTPPDTILAYPPTNVEPVPDTNPPITVPTNLPTENIPVTDPTTPTTPVAPVTDTPPPTNITTTLVADFHRVNCYYSKDEIDLDEVPSLQWEFTNKFGDPVYLEIQLDRRVLWKGYLSLDNKKKLYKFDLVWVERDRRYLIYNTTSLKPDLNYTKESSRQVDDITNADPVCVELEINQPIVAEIYYSRNSKIDDINRTSQDDLQLERKLQTKDWSIEVNTSILGMDDIDTYYLGKSCD